MMYAAFFALAEYDFDTDDLYVWQLEMLLKRIGRKEENTLITI